MDKDHKIWESSDSEFLSFLYAERDREYSKYSAWGVNFWVAGAAVIGLLGYAYSQISSDYNAFDWHLFVLYSNVLGAILIALVTIAHPLISNGRWSNEYRVTTIRANVQPLELIGKIYIAISSIIFLGYWTERNIVYWLWIVLWGIEFAIWLYVLINGDKLVRMNSAGRVFSNVWWEVCYRGIECGLCMMILCAAIKIWGEYALGVKEFEMGCVFAIIIGISWIILLRVFYNRHESIDKWIDQYIYGNLSKEDAYLCMLEYAQGYDAVDVIRTDFEKIKPLRDKMSEFQELHTRYLKMAEEGKLDLKDGHQYLSDVAKEIAVLDETRDIAKKLVGKLREIIKLDTRPSSSEIWRKMLEEISRFIDDINQFQSEVDEVMDVLTEFVQSYQCTKYGGICDKMDCPNRNEKKSFIYAMKHRLSKFKSRNTI